ncbi:prevent-host-death family protein [Nocardia tenerifensis]|uniref:Antitoxin n=2 Tax=Nocardia tenerifensis TaxID=228006 RepID=A0A318KCK0_9NOCA|nr:prevent-host-death family protein [Nocardia tenerifensis]
MLEQETDIVQWQVQEAKQRFSEVLRAAESNGPQTITRHGDAVAVVIDIDEYRRLMRPDISFVDHLLVKFSGLGDEVADVLDEVERERELSRPREVDLFDGTAESS